MCGLVGILGINSMDLKNKIEKMSLSLEHRGPDGNGVWIDSENGIGLGHRRLSIIDRTSSGAQPMISSSGRYVIAFNGEIYNFLEIKENLTRLNLAPRWRGNSDTEVLLAAIEAWGLKEAIKKVVGMFAISLWDRHNYELSLIRDRVGEKPLYYCLIGGVLYFGSELKSILAGLNVKPEIDLDALAQFMQLGYIVAPKSIYSQISKVMPGHILVIRQKDKIHSSSPYWTLAKSSELSSESFLFDGGEDEVIGRIHNQIKRSVASQMISDVPIGACLSGGIDSSLIVSVMQKSSATPINTFTIGFDEDGFNEAENAENISKYLGTNHTELYVSGRDALKIIPSLSGVYDEPFADNSQIPTILLSSLVGNKVSVCLSGDGGDELFGGYNRYAEIDNYWNRIRNIPYKFRKIISNMSNSAAKNEWHKLLEFVLPIGANSHRMKRFSNIISSKDFPSFYVNFISQWHINDKLVLGCNADFESNLVLKGSCESLEYMRTWDLQHYLPDNILVKVDRASMSVGLESRAPFLNHDLIELAFSLPNQMLSRDGSTKWILRNILSRYLPPSLMTNSKKGFSAPIAKWLRSELREWGESLLNKDLILSQGILNEKKISAMWKAHQSGRVDYSSYLWNILMFQAWYLNYVISK